MGGNPFGAPNIDAMAAFGFPGPNMNPQVRVFLNKSNIKYALCIISDKSWINFTLLSVLFSPQAADQLLKLMTDPK